MNPFAALHKFIAADCLQACNIITGTFCTVQNLQEDKREYAVKWKDFEGITVEPHQNLNEYALNSFYKHRDVGARATLSEVGTL